MHKSLKMQILNDWAWRSPIRTIHLEILDLSQPAHLYGEDE